VESRGRMVVSFRLVGPIPPAETKVSTVLFLMIPRLITCAAQCCCCSDDQIQLSLLHSLIWYDILSFDTANRRNHILPDCLFHLKKVRTLFIKGWARREMVPFASVTQLSWSSLDVHHTYPNPCPSKDQIPAYRTLFVSITSSPLSSASFGSTGQATQGWHPPTGAPSTLVSPGIVLQRAVPNPSRIWELQGFVGLISPRPNFEAEFMRGILDCPAVVSS
jgi:hypothetical protein